jgi:hypothetical protein
MAGAVGATLVIIEFMKGSISRSNTGCFEDYV